MIVPDISLLLYAYDSSSPFHAKAASWWSSALSGAEPVGLPHVVLFGFVRIATSGRVFRNPLSVAAAFETVNLWLGRNIASVLEPAPNHVKRTAELLMAANSSGGNLITTTPNRRDSRPSGATVSPPIAIFFGFSGVRCEFPLDA
ncbi:MAG: hypothetical protein H7A53_09370 [Akkermansiaceae bacterium]|nr:hypothetical protein [Akkermansiaceae bacterium]